MLALRWFLFGRRDLYRPVTRMAATRRELGLQVHRGNPPYNPRFLPRRLNEGEAALGRPPGRIPRPHPTRDSRRFFLAKLQKPGAPDEAGRISGAFTSKRKMREVGLSQGHQAGCRGSPKRKEAKTARWRSSHSRTAYSTVEEEVDPQALFLRTASSQPCFLYFFRDEGVPLAFDLVFWCAGKLAFLANNGFNDGLGVANRNSDSDCHYKKGMYRKGPPPIFGDASSFWATR